ncbi:MAG: RNA polymerase sigma-70 factor [Massilibacteroides sp.]|nr:RNA polymerase sigma-70 factor [Massilibacteroides sp.]MDD3061873.1 RNA polymerase sigma-70 factor [Massilibacteroides sp.]MDD4115149.1 RNA polymerase sigma-70 factor [Massilibacteroides sp.]MDD4661250.1 RNA polymerase sigma-70 factor [Massilibacteroides sp.]
MNTISENTLNILREGNHKAFEEVFVAYFDKIKIFIFGYIKSEVDAEELTEDIFVNLWINHASIDPSRSFSSYMHTIARNAALNFLRHKFIRESHENNIVEFKSNFNSEDELIAKETALLIEMAIEKMPEQRKKIYQLSRNEGLKNEEIAICLNITKTNVESQLSLALKDIRKVIASIFLFFP